MNIPSISIEDDRYIFYDNGKIWSKFSKKFIGNKNKKTGYVITTLYGETRSVHRVIYEKFVGKIPDGYEIDHINDKPDDNRVENLEALTHEQNNQKKQKQRSNTSGYIGVDFRKDNKSWRVQLQNNNKRIFSKSGFKTAAEANTARNNFIEANPVICKYYTKNL